MLAMLLYNVTVETGQFSVVRRSVAGLSADARIQAILIAVALSILRFVRLVSRPKIEVLGKVEGFPGFHSIERHPEVKVALLSGL